MVSGHFPLLFTKCKVIFLYFQKIYSPRSKVSFSIKDISYKQSNLNTKHDFAFGLCYLKLTWVLLCFYPNEVQNCFHGTYKVSYRWTIAHLSHEAPANLFYLLKVQQSKNQLGGLFLTIKFLTLNISSAHEVQEGCHRRKSTHS